MRTETERRGLRLEDNEAGLVHELFGVRPLAEYAVVFESEARELDLKSDRKP